MIVRVVEGEDRYEPDRPVTDVGVPDPPPPVVGVIEEVRSQPARTAASSAAVLLARVEDEPDAAHFAPALDPPGHLVVWKIVLQPLLQPIGAAGIQALADERLQVVSQRLRQLGVRNAGHVRVLDDVAGVDVLVVIGLGLAADDEEHARLAIRIDDGAHRCDVARPLLFDACRQLVEAFLLERRTGEALNVLPKAGAQPIGIEPGHLRRGDDGAVGYGEALIRRGLRSGRQQVTSRSKCAHAHADSKD